MLQLDHSPPDLILAMCNSIFGKGQQAVGAGQDGVRRGLTKNRILCSHNYLLSHPYLYMDLHDHNILIHLLD